MSSHLSPSVQIAEPAAPGWRQISAASLLAGDHLSVEQIHVATPARPGGVKWTVARRKSAVVIAPQLADGRFLLIHQERAPIQRTIWEFPAGQIDDRENKEDSAVITETALRELEEETGHHVGEDGELISLGYFFSSPGFTDEHAYLFLAKGVEPMPSRAAELGIYHEQINEARAFSLEELHDMIRSNTLADANSLAIMARLAVLNEVELHQKANATGARASRPTPNHD